MLLRQAVYPGVNAWSYQSWQDYSCWVAHSCRGPSWSISWCCFPINFFTSTQMFIVYIIFSDCNKVTEQDFINKFSASNHCKSISVSEYHQWVSEKYFQPKVYQVIIKIIILSSNVFLMVLNFDVWISMCHRLLALPKWLRQAILYL